jgi:preprotein translocase subunit YajC
VGQKIMLTSGIHGELAGLGDETLELTIAPGTVITVHRQAVMKTLSEPDAAERSDTDEPVPRDGEQPA